MSLSDVPSGLKTLEPREPETRSAPLEAARPRDVRAGDRAARDRRQLREARPAPAGQEPGDVHRRGRQRPHDVPVLPRPRPGRARRRTGSPGSSPSSCGSRCCSPTSPRRWPRAGARRRPRRCARPAPRRSRTSARPTARSSRRPSSKLQVGDLCVVRPGQIIPGDGDVVEGIASVDESAITGESAPVIRESGGDRCAVTGGTRVLSDEIVVQITSKPGETFLDRMIALVEGAERQKTPNEIALNILLAGLTIIFMLAVVTLQPFAIYSGAQQSIVVLVALARVPHPDDDRRAALGDRHRRHGPAGAAQRAGDERPGGRSGRRLLDAAARQDRHDHARQPRGRRVPARARRRRAATLAEAAQLSSLADETPEGRSIVVLAKDRFGLRERELGDAQLVPFTAQTRMSGIDIGGRVVRKGAADAVAALGRRGGRRRARDARADRRAHRPRRRHAARRGRERHASSASSTSRTSSSRASRSASPSCAAWASAP